MVLFLALIFLILLHLILLRLLEVVPLHELADKLDVLAYCEDHCRTEKVAEIISLSLYNQENKLAQEMLEIAKQKSYCRETGVFRTHLSLEDCLEISCLFRNATDKDEFHWDDTVWYNEEKTQGKVTEISQQDGAVYLSIIHTGGVSRVPAWKVRKIIRERTQSLKTDSPSDKATIPNQDTGTWRCAVDKPPEDLGDYLIHRLGLQQYITRKSKHEKEEEEEDLEDYSVFDYDNEEDDHTGGGERRITTKDFAEIFTTCDTYEMGRVAQKIIDLDLMLPIYHNCVGDDGANSSFGDLALALRYTHVPVIKKTLESHRIVQVPFVEDTDLPRVLFVTYGAKSIGHELIQGLFEAVSNPIPNDCDNCSSIQLGVKQISKKISQKLKSPDPNRKNWMIVHTNLGCQGTKELSFSRESSFDFVFVEKNEAIEELLPGNMKGNIFYLQQAEGKGKVENASKCISGGTAYISTCIFKLMLDPRNNLLTDREALLETLSTSPSNKNLRKFCQHIKEDVENCEPVNSTYRRELQLGVLSSLRCTTKRDVGKTAAQVDKELSKIDEKMTNIAVKFPSIVKVLFNILSRESRSEKLLGCLELSKCLVEIEKKSLKADNERVSHLEADLDKNLKDGCKQLTKAKSDLNKKKTGLVHVWRELSLLYTANYGISGRREHYERCPELAAKYLYDGGTIELVDGDACTVNQIWMKKVLESANDLLKEKLKREAKVLVVSAAGVQSCGKSTLLNSLFGVEMETSVGCCTRGVNLALVPSKGWKAEFDYVLVMDTEGLCNPTFMEERWYHHHNNWLAAMAILGPDVCCLLSNNEDDTIVRTVLPFAMLCHHNAEETLTQAGFNKRHLLFVYNKINPEKAQQCLQDNRVSMMKTLEEKKEEIRKEFESSDIGGDMFNLMGTSQFSYLGPELNDPEGYGKNVIKLRQSIDDAIGSDFQAASLTKWWGMFSCLLDALDKQDYALSFQSLIAVKSALERDKKNGEMESCVYELWEQTSTQVLQKMQEEYSKGAIVTPESDWKAELKEFTHQEKGKVLLQGEIHSATKEYQAFLSNHNHKEFKEMELRKWDEFLREAEIHYTNHIERKFYVFKYEKTKKADFENAFVKTLRESVTDVEKKKNLGDNPELMKVEFEKAFSTELQKIQENNPTIVVWEQVDKAWPQAWKFTEEVRSGKSKTRPQKNEKGVLVWIQDKATKVYRKITGNNEEEEMEEEEETIEEDMETIDKETLMRNIINYINKLRVREMKLPNISENVQQYLKLFKSVKLDLVTKIEIANDMRPDLQQAIEYNTRKWEREHNLYMKFSYEKDKFWAMFKLMCSNLSEEELVIEQIMDTIWRISIPSFIHKRTTEEYKSHIQGKKYLIDMQCMLAHMNIDIIDMAQKNIKNAILALGNVEQHRMAVQEKLMNETIDEIAELKPKNLHDKYMDIVKTVFKKLQTEVEMLPSKTLEKEEKEENRKEGRKTLTGEEFKQLLSEKLCPLEIDSTVLTNFVAKMKTVDPRRFAKELTTHIEKEMPAFEDVPWKEKYSSSWAEVKESIPKIRDADKPQCPAVCPRCKSPCIYKELHKDKHDCYHQPQGLVGVWVHDTGELAKRSCKDCVDQDWEIIGIGAYADFEKYFPEWNKPNLVDGGENYKFRRIFFFKFQEELAQHFHHKKCSEVENVGDFGQYKEKLKSLT